MLNLEEKVKKSDKIEKVTDLMIKGMPYFYMWYSGYFAACSSYEMNSEEPGGMIKPAITSATLIISSYIFKKMSKQKAES